MKKIIELFVFINPLDSISYNMEKIATAFAKEREEKVELRFVPILNFHTISHYLSTQEIKGADLQLKNDLYLKAYEMSLAFEAAAMQGKKAGRDYLMALQEAILIRKVPMTKWLISQIAEDCGLDLELFEEDLHSEFSKEDFQADQQLARKMGVTNTPGIVIYNDRQDSYGCLIESHFSKQLLHGICNMDITDTHTIQEIQQKYNLQFI